MAIPDGKSSAPLVRVSDPRGGSFLIVEDWVTRLWRDDCLLPVGSWVWRKILKETKSRRVEEVGLDDGGRVIVKSYLLPTGLERWKDLLLPGAAVTEWRRGRALRDAGVDGAEPLAHGRRQDPDTGRAASVLVMSSLVGFEDLSEVFRCDAQHSERRRALAHALGDLMRRLHDAGLAHGDPHLGNFLVGWDGDVPRVVPVDLRRLRIGAALSSSARRRNLVLLYQTMGGLVGDADRLRFLASYFDREGRVDARREARALAPDARAALRRYRRRRASVAYSTNHRFRRLRAGGVVWQVRREEEDADLRDILEDPERALANRDQVLKEGRSTLVARVGRWVVKRIQSRRAGTRISDQVRRSKALRALRNAFLLEISGIPTVAAAAAGARRGAVFTEPVSYLVTRHVAGLSIDRWLENATRGTGLSVLARCGKLIGRLHGVGISHRDLKAANILVTSDGHPLIVDVDGVRPRRVIPLSRVTKELARLFRDLGAAGIAEDGELAFVKGYLRVSPSFVTGAQTPHAFLRLIHAHPRAQRR